uniref:DUF2782 domain-containing protein n=1 Tax=Candidatus Kentrum sp. LFY TaxID=2126342 RepID=A0A450ULL7_9GAMM|nr:MAG: Protein of unknown function (DUF2782) [Candidatus Kentron sp. LFY]
MPRKKTCMIPMATYALFSLILSNELSAQSKSAGLEPVPGPPPLPSVESGKALEPDITIIQGKREIVHEYPINGRLYAVKIIPKHGSAYYMIDTNGDGNLETREQFVLSVPQWVLFSW